MGSGLALQIKETHPHVFALYKLKCLETKPTSKLLGECQIVSSGMKFVANLFGQDGYGYSKQQTDVKSLKISLQQLKEYAQRFRNTVALPYKIGSDRGGADWNEVYGIIEEVFEDYEVTLYNYNG